MKKMIVLLYLLLAGLVAASDNRYIGPDGGTNINDPNFWSLSHYPTSSEIAVFDTNAPTINNAYINWQGVEVSNSKFLFIYTSDVHLGSVDVTGELSSILFIHSSVNISGDITIDEMSFFQTSPSSIVYCHSIYNSGSISKASSEQGAGTIIYSGAVCGGSSTGGIQGVRLIPSSIKRSDINADTKVDMFDLAILGEEWLQ